MANENEIVSEDFLLNKKMSDVTLVVDNKEFPAHRFVLGAKSEVFYNMFYGDMKESHQKLVAIEGASADTFAMFLKFIYSANSCELTDAQQAMDVLSLAHQYQINGIVNMIENTLTKLLLICNVCVIYKFAKFYSLNALLKSCGKFVTTYINILLKDETFLMSPIDELKQLLSISRIPVTDKQVINKALNFIRQKNPKENLECLSNLIPIEKYTIMELIDDIRPLGVLNIDYLFKIIKDRNKMVTEYLNREKQVFESNRQLQDYDERYRQLFCNYYNLKQKYQPKF